MLACPLEKQLFNCTCPGHFLACPTIFLQWYSLLIIHYITLIIRKSQVDGIFSANYKNEWGITLHTYSRKSLIGKEIVISDLEYTPWKFYLIYIVLYLRYNPFLSIRWPGTFSFFPLFLDSDFWVKYKILVLFKLQKAAILIDTHHLMSTKTNLILLL